MSQVLPTTTPPCRPPVHPVAKERLLKVLKAIQLAVDSGVSFEAACRLLGTPVADAAMWRAAYLAHGLQGLSPEVLP